jgi:HK97 gp10 family phage protein
MDITVDTSQIKAFAGDLKAAQPLVTQEMTSAMQRATLAVESDAKARVAVKTGNLRRSITSTARASAGGVEGRIGTNTPYARYVEEGRGPIDAGEGRVLRFEIGGEVLFRRRVGPAAARPYLRPAFDAQRGRIRTEFAQVPKRVIARLAA